MNIELDFRSGDLPERNDRGAPANLLLIGNFSGHPQAAAGQPVVNMSTVEPGELDAALRALKPHLRLQDGALEVPFQSMDDFHPDRLLAALPMYPEVSALKKALGDPASSRNAAIVCRKLLGLPEQPAAPSPPEAAPTESEDDVLTRLLGQPKSGGDRKDPRVTSAVQKILEQAGAGDAAAQPAPETSALQAQLDAFLGAALRELLHSGEFRALEAAWRSAEWLVQNLDTDEEMNTWLIDVGAARAGLWAPEFAEKAARSFDGVAGIIVLDEFTDSADSIEDLEALGAAAERLATRAYAAANGALAGVASLPEAGLALDATDIAGEQSELWSRARQAACAGRLVLGFPRLLLRQPYGDKSDPLDRLSFEELPPAPDHELFLWGSPAPALAVMDLLKTRQIDELPMVVYDDGSGQAIKPPCEAYISDSAAERIRDRGIVPLIAHRGQTSARVVAVESIAG